MFFHPWHKSARTVHSCAGPERTMAKAARPVTLSVALSVTFGPSVPRRPCLFRVKPI